MGFKPRYRRVCVHWDDATADPGWHDDGEHTFAPHIVSVGYLVRRNAKEIVIAGSANSYDHVCDLLLIPMGCVTKVERLSG